MQELFSILFLIVSVSAYCWSAHHIPLRKMTVYALLFQALYTVMNFRPHTMEQLCSLWELWDLYLSS